MYVSAILYEPCYMAHVASIKSLLFHLKLSTRKFLLLTLSCPLRKKFEGGVSEVRFRKTRLLHIGNVEKSPHSQFSAQRAPEG